MEIKYGFMGALAAMAAIATSIHVILVKREPRAAALWLLILWVLPLLGPVLYALFGINRIHRRQSDQEWRSITPHAAEIPAQLDRDLGVSCAHLMDLARVTNRICEMPLLGGNHVRLLINGEQAYPAMLAAIESAQISISLSTYIFGNDRVGNDFASALQRANQRGVEVRILIDNAGERYSWPSMVGVLRRMDMRVARFSPRFPARLTGINLRNHRKLLVIDGKQGFTGGMNIRINHLQDQGRRSTRDLHFELHGPIVHQLQEVFVQDWFYACGETLRGSRWFTEQRICGSTWARGIPDGPEVSFEKIKWVLLAALNTAKQRICIMTPYFLPDLTLVAALNLAVMRGVTVDILLPEKNNLIYVHWAMMAHLPHVVGHGCRVWFTAAPFDHGKLMLVDDAWVLLGSANWDARSLRLNFEFDVECYDPVLARQISGYIDHQLQSASLITMTMLMDRSLPVRLRDGIARLFMPFL
jgi:cardiolipin synthase